MKTWLTYKWLILAYGSTFPGKGVTDIPGVELKWLQNSTKITLPIIIFGKIFLKYHFRKFSHWECTRTRFFHFKRSFLKTENSKQNVKFQGRGKPFPGVLHSNEPEFFPGTHVSSYCLWDNFLMNHKNFELKKLRLETI